MGIRINSVLLNGVKFTKKETNAFEKFMKGKNGDFFLMRLIEREIEKRNVEESSKKKFSQRLLSMFSTELFIKRNNKTKKPLKPYRPFWKGLSGKDLEDVSKDVYYASFAYMENIGMKTEYDDKVRFWWPQSRSDCQLPFYLGKIMERNYAREVDYALMGVLGFDNGNDVYVVKGSRPWECGTTQDRDDKNLWHTFNGQHMIPEIYMPKNKKEADKILKEIFWYKGKRKDFIAKKKKIFDQYGKNVKPYKIYPGEGWFGSDYHFYEVDELFRLISEYIPEIKYDVMRLERFLCFYWS